MWKQTARDAFPIIRKPVTGLFILHMKFIRVLPYPDVLFLQFTLTAVCYNDCNHSETAAVKENPVC